MDNLYRGSPVCFRGLRIGDGHPFSPMGTSDLARLGCWTVANDCGCFRRRCCGRERVASPARCRNGRRRRNDAGAGDTGCRVGSSRRVFSSAVGLAAPFLAFDLSRAAGFPLPYSLYVCVALGGLVAGLGQSIFLRRAARRAWLWVPGSALGWSLAAATAAIANVLPRALSLRGLAGAGIYLTIVLGGGLILGSVTGLLLVRLDWRKTGSGTGGAASTGRK